MINREVVPAFDMLLEELDSIIPELNQQGSALMNEKKYLEARGVITKAESVIAFQAKIKALRDEWLGMEVPATKVRQPAIKKQPKKKVSRTTTTKLEEGKRTKNKVFHMPILQFLVNQGGSAQFHQIEKGLEIEMADTLNQYDWETLPDGKTIRWKNNVGWAKTPLLNAGYLSTTAPIGTWQITEAGRQALEDSKKKQ